MSDFSLTKYIKNMREGLAISTRITKEVTGDLSGGEKVRYSGTYEPGKGLNSIFAAVTRDDRQVLTINHQRKGQVGYNFSMGDDFKTMETVIGEVLSDIDGLYDEISTESVRLTVENGIITGVSND